MALRPVVAYPHAALDTEATDVPNVDDDLRTLVEDMIETMRAENGVGLAANQVDDLRRVTVVDPSGGDDPDQLKVLVNPRILATRGKVSGEEGCLSFPGIFETIDRPLEIDFTYRDLDFNEIEESAEGFLARVVCHEVDHLDGVVFLKRMSPLKRRFVLKKISKLKRNGEWPDSD